MPLFGRSKPRRLHPAWTYTSPGVLWRVQPATAALLVAEERDVEKKHAAFAALSMQSGTVAWRRTFGDPWWVGVETVHNGILVLHGFTTPDLPEHKGVTAVDVTSGEVVWEQKDARYRLMLGETILLSDSGGRFIEFDLRTGAVVRDYGADLRVLGEARGRAAQLSIGNLEGAEYPVPLEYATEQDPTLLPALRTLFGKGVIPAAELITAGEVIICAYRSATESAASPEVLLGIVERCRERVLFNDRVTAAFGMPIADAFFVLRGMLYFVREQRELVAVQLADGRHQ